MKTTSLRTGAFAALLSLSGMSLTRLSAAENEPPPKLSAIEIKAARLVEGAAPASLAVSPDRKRIAYFRATGDGEKCSMIVDDIEGARYDALDRPLFSPDSRHVAYVASRKGRKFSVVDGVEGKEYEAVAGITFSPDSKQTAYIAVQDDERFVVLDGVEQPVRFDAVHASGPIFSPDSQRLGYAARRGVKWFAVVDGKEGKEYDGAGAFVFGPDSKHWAHFAERGENALIVLDGAESEQYDGILRDTSLIFTTPFTVEALVYRDAQILRVALSYLGPAPSAPAVSR